MKLTFYFVQVALILLWFVTFGALSVSIDNAEDPEETFFCIRGWAFEFVSVLMDSGEKGEE
jgi:hypothetical protein